MNSLESRINLDVPLETLSKVVCEKFGLGNFVSNVVIEIGYEDFNYVLKTDKSQVVVKVFAQTRTDEDCKNLADRAAVPNENGFSSPKIFETNGRNLLEVKIKNTKFRLIVMEKIDGKDFFSLGEIPNLEELKTIGKELAKLNKIQFNPPFVYDRWAIVNFRQEFDKNKALLSESDCKSFGEILKEFEKCDFSKLKFGFVHGDIIVTNILKDASGKLFFIDFSVSNFLPRIVDLAVSIGDLCMVSNDESQAKERTKAFLEAYEKASKLSGYEKECLKVFLKVHQATSILNCLREKIVEKNDSKENTDFLEKSKLALKMLLNFDLF